MEDAGSEEEQDAQEEDSDKESIIIEDEGDFIKRSSISTQDTTTINNVTALDIDLDLDENDEKQFVKKRLKKYQKDLEIPLVEYEQLDTKKTNNNNSSGNNEEIITALISDKNEEVAKMGIRTWIKFFRAYGGLRVFGFVSLILVIRNTASALTMFQIENWTTAGVSGFSANFSYLMWYFAAEFTAQFLIFGKNIPLINAGYKRGLKFYREIFTSIINAPLQEFFDRVPSGKILDRFVNNLGWLASSIMHFNSWCLHVIHDFFEVLVVQAILCSPWIIPI